jgi:beta-glucosidase
MAVFGLLAASPAVAGAFPPGFKWCVATAAHQIEGGNERSDWWAFEQQPGRIKNGDRSGDAADHWHRLEQDVQLLRELGVTQYRFSVEWAKIEPVEGRIDDEALEHYVDEVRMLRASGIEPLVTLMHFTLPAWVAAKGGWAWDGIVPAFAAQAARVEAALGPYVRDWVTVNEPMVAVLNGYVLGLFPPAQTDFATAVLPMTNMLKAHAAAYHALHRAAATAGRTARVGVAHHLRLFEPWTSWNPLDRYIVQRIDAVWNWAFFDALETGRLVAYLPFTLDVDTQVPDAAGTQDFVGINYYTRDRLAFSLTAPGKYEQRISPGTPLTDLGWEIYPEGLYAVVKEASAHAPGRSIMITENGLADAADSRRAGFLRDHLGALQHAIADGVPVEGYCHWSLLDNFEWAEGFAPRFGLYAVDYATQERTLRPSGEVFRQIVRSNGL